MGASPAYNSAILITSPPSTNLAANFALQDTGDHQNFQVSAANSAYRYWDKAASFTFQTSPDGVVWTTVAPSSIQYVGGKVKFPAVVTGGTPSARVTAGKYFAWSVLAEITSAEVNSEWNLEDSTTFTGNASGAGGNPNTVVTPTVPKGSIKIKKWYVPESSVSFFDYMDNRTPLIISYVAPGGARIESYVWDTKMAIATAWDKLVEQELEFQFDGPFYRV